MIAGSHSDAPGDFAGYQMHPRQFGNFHKVEDPSEKCADVSPDDHTGRHPRREDDRCSKYVSTCMCG